MSSQKKAPASQNGHLLQPVPTSSDDVFHIGGRKRLGEAVQDFQMTLQHAIRMDLLDTLKSKSLTDSLGIMPPLNLHEQFDYMLDTDTEFLNWMFPYCAVKLTKSGLPHTFAFLIENFRRELKQLDELTSPTYAE